MEKNLAVCVKNINKSYDGNQILNNFSMYVEEGTIYGLLGASGCGKTTLLGCIVGRKSISSGDIWVFGKTPGSKNSGVPGPTIGYMPQDVALVPEYTVKETIFYFGRVAGMGEGAISTRVTELTRLLDLPPQNKFVTKLSGGEQRRVSLAAAIVHEPALLILDEPTVGVDSILRDKIWKYFLNLVRAQGISVIMTTHYIEECKDADRVGFMRTGKLLAEDSPNNILALYETDTLEQAFLTMCLKDERGEPNTTQKSLHEATNLHTTQRFEIEEKSSEDLTQKDSFKSKTCMGINCRKMYALLDKNFKQFSRNMFGLVLFGLLPLSQTFFFLYGVGGDIKDLSLAIVNQELTSTECQTYDRNSSVRYDPETYECYFTNISCRFLEYLDDPMIVKVYYDTLEEAKDGIHHGKNIGVLYMGPNFTKSYQQRVKEQVSIDLNAIQTNPELGKIDVYLDMSNRETGGGLKYKLIELFMDFQDDLYSDCTWNTNISKIIREEYLFGKKNENFVIFMLPGLLVTLVFFFASTMTSHIIVSEKSEGVWDRSLASGVTTMEMAVGHLMLQVALSIYQSVGPVLICIFVFGVEYRGRLEDIIITIILQGICGLTFGFWISVECDTHTQAHILINGLLYPSMVMCGLMWPIDCIPFALRIISKCLPFTLPIEAVRSIQRKGWSLWDPKIVFCNLVPVAWIIFFVVLSLVRIKKRS